MAELEQGIRSEIAKLQRDGVSEEELQRVKAQVMAAQVYQRDSMFYQAMLIGKLESTRAVLARRKNTAGETQGRDRGTGARMWRKNTWRTMASRWPRSIRNRSMASGHLNPMAGECHAALN